MVILADYHQWPQSKRKGKDIITYWLTVAMTRSLRQLETTNGRVLLTVTIDHSLERRGRTISSLPFFPVEIESQIWIEIGSQFGFALPVNLSIRR
jgi:hypothetical protein